MPYLHYESDASRLKMARAIRRAETLNPQEAALARPEKPTRDDLLVEAYLGAQPGLHPRRTLDQFFYHSIDTSERDQDQVVYRYCKRRRLEEKIFMVDQLWMWIVSKDLIITMFPQRWQQPKNDPLNVLDGVIEDMNAKTRAPVRSVYEFAMLIVGRCSGMFDRHKLNDENYQFVDMFESSIGHVTNRETELFDRFNKASAFATKWLRESRRGRATRRGFWTVLEDDAGSRDDPRFMDALLAIGTETRLLAEIKDIRDELNMIRMVLRSQTQVMNDFADRLWEQLWEEFGERKSDEAADMRKRSKDQLKVIDAHIANLDRMDDHAYLIYNSLANLLDLKQKHSNAFEARFARAQAVLQARQGQTIMVFTIVTIIFLPMSFIASVFSINIAEFPRRDGQTAVPWSYAAKFMCTPLYLPSPF
jgi:Mg2+ and Co2+ transporter CorA